MQAKAIAVAQQKGGAGKTTLAVQLGVCWSLGGLKVALLDVDPQGSMAAWSRLRAGAGVVKGPDTFEVTGWKLATEIDRLKSEYDLLIIDTPPHAETDARVAVRSASLVVVPVQPSPMDLWATDATLELARREKTDLILVLNRVPPRGKLMDAIRARIDEDGLPLADTTLGNRSAFAASMLEGLGVAEYQPRGTATAEIAALADEVAARLNLKKGKAA